MVRPAPLPQSVSPGELVAVALPPGPGWIEVVEGAWERGVALLPLDTRLPGHELTELLERARPGHLLDETGWTRLGEGAPAEGLALVMHTSGTAGVPKLVELGRPAVEAAVRSSALALGTTGRERWVCCLPPAHVGGSLVVLRAVVLGAPVLVHERFDEEAVRRDGGDLISVVPTMLRRLLEARVDVSGFRAILVGGAALRPDLREAATRAGARLVETYGLTETCGGIVYEGAPLPGTDVRAPDGLIEVRGPTLMDRYRGDPAGTASAATPDGWLRTADAGSIDGDGILRVLGRADEAITSGGEKVWPQEVEAALSTHPSVAAVAVGGRPDPEWGERVVAFVVPADPGAPPTLGALREHVSATIARYKAPRELQLVGSLPRTSSGKLRRSALSATRE